MQATDGGAASSAPSNAIQSSTRLTTGRCAASTIAV
jgi:hypothetical protein